MKGKNVIATNQDAREPFAVSPEQKRFLLKSLAEADRGEFVDVDDVLAELDESN